MHRLIIKPMFRKFNIFLASLLCLASISYSSISIAEINSLKVSVENGKTILFVNSKMVLMDGSVSSRAVYAFALAGYKKGWDLRVMSEPCPVGLQWCQGLPGSVLYLIDENDD